jgi:ElaB/YqjD/DUF883 family membrane-anchored ribosome-binding protein
MAERMWLYRNVGLVMGPVNTEQLLRRIETCELDDNTEVQEMGKSVPMVAMNKIEFFQVPLAKANAKRRVMAQVRAQEKADKIVRQRTMTVLAVASVIGVVLLALLGRYLAVHTSFFGKKVETEESMAVTEVTIGGASAEETIRYQVKPGPNNASGSSGKGPSMPGMMGQVVVKDADGMETTELNRDQLNAYTNQNLKHFTKCFQNYSTGGRTVPVLFDYVVKNDGTAAQLTVQTDEFRTGSIFECLQSAMKSIQYPKFEGARPTIPVRFTLRPKAKQ